MGRNDLFCRAGTSLGFLPSMVEEGGYKEKPFSHQLGLANIATHPRTEPHRRVPSLSLVFVHAACTTDCCLSPPLLIHFSSSKPSSTVPPPACSLSRLNPLFPHTHIKWELLLHCLCSAQALVHLCIHLFPQQPSINYLLCAMTLEIKG